MASVQAIPECRRLPKKEADLYRSIVKYYEIKQYKKGVKAADAVLKKFPKHGETQAMKALVLNCLDKKEEAYDLVKQGLRNDVRSGTCWHVFGLLHRSDRNYGEAIKCYLNALRIESSNLNILRDLANLQVQMRDLPGFAESRRQIVCQKPGLRIHWIGYAVAAHLAGQHELAIKVIDQFLSTQESRERGYEEGELVLYKAHILEQAGRLEEALALLDAEQKFVVDGLSWRVHRAKLLALLGRRAEATEAYRALVDENPENYRFHAGLQAAAMELDPAQAAAAVERTQGCALPCHAPTLTEAQRAALLQVYDALAAAHPKSLACQRIPLAFIEGEAFTARVDAYMRRHLQRGLPSLGADLAALYRPVDFESPPSSAPDAPRSPPQHPATGAPLARAKDAYDVAQDPKYGAIKGLVDGYLTALEASGGASLGGSANGSGGSGSGSSEELKLWTTFLHSQLLEARGLLGEALAAVERCVAMAPDTTARIDMLQRKARLLKRAGDVEGAAAAMDGARQLDLGDRYINNKTTKYLLRAGQVEAAQATIALFARHEGDPQHNLFEMQCMWYELEWARAMAAKAAAAPPSETLALLGRALKKYGAVEKHFADFAEDQFDFHGYCVRKGTLRAYVDVLRLEDELLAHPFYQRAARGLVSCYLAAHAAKAAQQGGEEGAEPDYSGMTAEERKRAKAKARKAAKKAEAEAEERKQAEAAQQQQALAAQGGDKGAEKDNKGGDGGKKKPPADDDPDGEKLLAKDPLAECARVVATLGQHARKCLATHVLAYDVAKRRGKVLLALQALVRGRALRPNDPELVLRTVDFFVAVDAGTGFGGAEGAAPHPTAAAVVAAERAALLGGQDKLEAFVDAYASKAEGWASLPHALAAARARALVRPAGAAAAAQGVVAALKGPGAMRGVSVDGLQEALRVLREDLGADAAVVAEARAACAARFPLAAAFK